MINQKQIANQKRYYNQLAPDFDQKFERENTNHLYKIQEIGKLFSKYIFTVDKPLASILEIGGGTGIHAFHLLQSHAASISSFTINDLSEEMLNIAKKRLASFNNITTFTSGAAEEIESNKKFDGIFISGAMHHFSNPTAAIVQIKKLLAPKGMVIICEPNVLNPVNFFKAAIKKEEWGQFFVTRKFIANTFIKTNLKIVENRILHYKSENPVLKKIIPYQQFEKLTLLDPFAVMFLIAAKNM